MEGLPWGSDGRKSACNAGAWVHAQLCPTLGDPVDFTACQAPLATEFSRQEHWSGYHFPLQGDLPNPGIEPTSLVSPTLAGGFFTTAPPGKPRVQSLGWKDALEEGMATHSSIPAWRIPQTKESSRLQSVGSLRVGHDWVTFTFTVYNYTLH